MIINVFAWFDPEGSFIDFVYVFLINNDQWGKVKCI